MHQLNKRWKWPARRVRLAGLIAIGLSCLTFGLFGQELIYQESFETDGEGTRYTITDGAVDESQTVLDQTGPLYWAHNFEVSVVGVRVLAPARRGVLMWHHTIPADSVSDDAKDALSALIDWLVEGRSGTTALFSLDPAANSGDQVIADILTSKGFTIQVDADPIPDASQVALVVSTSAGAISSSRYTNYAAPLLTYTATNHDDELTSSIGASNALLSAEEATVTTPGHPAAADISGSFPWVSGETGFDTIGSDIPDDAVVLVSAVTLVSPPIESLAAVDEMVAGNTPAILTEGAADRADLFGNSGGSWGLNRALPGDPQGGFGVVATGTLNVLTPGTYSFAVGIDDGARLRIDVDQNGITDADNVIVEDATGAFRELFADVTFPAAGEYAMELTAFNATGDFGAEVSVTFAEASGQQGPVNFDFWTPLGEHFPEDGVQLIFPGLELDVYVSDAPPVESTRPAIVVLDEGQRLFGREITGQEGDGFFAGGGLNKFGNGGEKALTLNPIDVSGHSNLKLTFAVAGTDLDFETSDYLDVWIDPNNTGAFEQLVRFTAPTADDKFVTDGRTRARGVFQDVSYDLPDGATDLVIEFRALTTWWNEIIAFDNVRVSSGEIIVDPPADPSILLIVNTDLALESDALAEQWLNDMTGMTVIVVDDSVVSGGGYTLADATADNVQLVYIASSVNSGDAISQPWWDLGVPVVNVEQAVQDDFLTVDPLDARGNFDAQDSILIAEAAGALSELGGLPTGELVFTSAPVQTHWGTVIGDALVIGTQPDDPTHALFYAVEAGSTLQDGSTSSARYVHIGLFGDDSLKDATVEGRHIWDVAVAWALDMAPPQFPGGGPVDGGGVQFELSNMDIGIAGDPIVPGSADIRVTGRNSYDVDVTAGGSDIWGADDSGHYVYTEWTGDFDASVQVTRLDVINQWSKAAIDVRESLDTGSRKLHVNIDSAAETPVDGSATGANTYEMGIRVTTGGNTGNWDENGGTPRMNVADSSLPAWMRLVREGNTFSALRSSDGVKWTLMGTIEQDYPETVFITLGTTSHNNDGDGFVTTAHYRDFTIKDAPTRFDLQNMDIGIAGDPVAPGSADIRESGFAYDVDVTAGGSDIWGADDSGHYVYTDWTGDFDASVEVVRLDVINQWSKAAIDARESLDTGSRKLHVNIDSAAETPVDGSATGANTYEMGIRVDTGGNTSNWDENGGTPRMHVADSSLPTWMRLVRQGDFFTAMRSSNGVQWTPIGHIEQSYPENMIVSLGTTSHNNDGADFVTTAHYRNFNITDAPPAIGLTGTDIGIAGDPVVPGSSDIRQIGVNTYDVDVTSGGSDIWGADDSGHYVYTEWTGDFDASVEVTRLDVINQWSKAAIDVRESLDTGSRKLHVNVDSAAETPADGSSTGANVYEVGARVETGGDTSAWDAFGGEPIMGAADTTLPKWMRMVREGGVFTAYRSDDGLNWSKLSSIEQDFPPTVIVALGTTSHNNDGADFVTNAEYRNFTIHAPTAAPAGPPQERPTLMISFDGTSVTVEWTSGTLQSAPAANGPWTDVTATSSHTEAATDAAKFYRAVE